MILRKLFTKKIEVEFRCRRPRGEKCYRGGLCKSEYMMDDKGEGVARGGYFICPHLVIMTV